MRCGYAPGERCLHHDFCPPSRPPVRGRSNLQLLMTQGARGGSGVDKFAEANIQSLRKFVAEANIQSLRCSCGRMSRDSEALPDESDRSSLEVFRSVL